MNFEDLATESKWNLLKELSKGKKSASDIAKKTATSLANVSIQLKLLEAKGIVKKSKPTKVASKNAGKPKVPFELAEDIILTGVLKQGMAERKLVRVRDLGDYERFALTTFLILDDQESYAVHKFCFESALLKKADLVAVLKTEGNEIELFIVLEHHLEEFRQKYSNLTIEIMNGKSKKIISWSHHKNEVEEGLARGDEYFKNLLLSKEILDKKNLMRAWNT